jgi:PAS domain S-box-containing protein
MISLGRYIREKREELHSRHQGYSIRSVARRIGVHHSYLSKVERGETDSLSEGRIQALARELGEDPDVLLALSGKLSSAATELVSSNPAGFVDSLRRLARDQAAHAGQDFYTRRLEGRKSELEELNRRLRQEMHKRQQAMKALAQSEARHREMFEKNMTVQLLIDPETGDIVDANPAACEFYGYERETMRGMNISLINTLPAHQVRKNMARAMKLEKTVFSFPHKTADGRVLTIETRSTPVVQGNKTVLHSIIIDVTRTRHLEEVLKREAAVKDAMAGIARALLTRDFKAGDMAGLILNKAMELTQSRYGLVLSIDRETGLAKGFGTIQIDGSCLIINGPPREMSWTPGADGKYPGLWGHALNTSDAFFSNTPGSHQSYVQPGTGQTPPENFLAVPVFEPERNSPAGLIVLACSIREYTPQDLAVIRELAHVFGLGLSFLNNESYSVVNQKSLASLKNSPEKDPGDDGIAHHEEGSQPLVMVVDDDLSTREFLVFHLKNQCYKTVEAETGQQALKMIPELKPDLVLLDVYLSDESGLELCSRIKTGLAPDVSPAVLLMSAWAPAGDMAETLNSGADDYIRKPVDPRELIPKVRTLLRRAASGEINQ